MQIDIVRNIILPVDEITVRLDPSPHPWQVEHQAAIDENWLHETDLNPDLFDGETVMVSQLRYSDRRISGICHPIRFATFLHWRRQRRANDGFHIFATAMPVTADNALVAVRMAHTTANAGRVYFAAGSFERSDFVDGLADATLNIHREVEEETGIRLHEVQRDSRFNAFCSASELVLVRRYYLDGKATAVARKIRSFIAGAAGREIDDAVIIRKPEDVSADSPAHMLPLVQWHFSGDVYGYGEEPA